MQVGKGMKKRIFAVAAVLILSLSGCGNAAKEPVSQAEPPSNSSSAVSQESAEQANIVNSSYFDETDLNTETQGIETEEIKLNGNSIEYSGSSAQVNGATITIQSPGVYQVRGTLNDGQILVDCEGTVRLVLAGANISSQSSAPIKIVNAEKVVITLPEGTESTVKDAEVYNNGDEATASIFSKSDLTFNGTGKLTVTGSCNDGITCKDTLKIVSGTFDITTADDGIIGRDLIVINDGNITINAGGDGIKATNDADENSGNILINGGVIGLTAVNDGIQAVSTLSVSGGEIEAVTGSGSSAAPVKSGNTMGGGSSQEETASSKGLKASLNIEISGGEIIVDSYDDSIHSNGNISITGGKTELSTGDDGIHADTKLVISEGEITVLKSYEGLESAEIIIDGGTMDLTSSDDGINAAGGADSSGTGGFMGGDMFSTSTGTLTINGGVIYVNAGGDGIDSNGDFTMTGGSVIVDGPEDGGNGALDYDGTFDLSGGTLIAGGSAQMAQSPSGTSSQYSVFVGTSQPAGTEILLKDSAGNTVLEYTPEKQVGCVLFSSPDIKEGESYTVTAGGETVGECTISSAVNTIGNISAGGPGGMGGEKGGGRMPGGFGDETPPELPNGGGRPNGM